MKAMQPGATLTPFMAFLFFLDETQQINEREAYSVINAL